MTQTSPIRRAHQRPALLDLFRTRSGAVAA
jgi:hypothetical protein